MKLKLAIALMMSFLLAAPAFSQEGFDPSKVDPEYTKVLIDRVDKFLKDLNIGDKAQYARVRDIVVRQYQGINWVEEQRDAKVEELKGQAEMEKPLMNARIGLAKSEAREEIFRLHAHFIAQLQTELSPEQVDGVKDGMTYGVLPRTYNGYLNLLPQLTEEEKRYVLANLLEARELAMDEGSSDEKHATFGKYKGRINNYLSERGYDMKKAEAELKEREEAKKGKANEEH